MSNEEILKYTGSTEKTFILSGGRSPESKDLRTDDTAVLTIVRRSFDSLSLAQDDRNRKGSKTKTRKTEVFRVNAASLIRD